MGKQMSVRNYLMVNKTTNIVDNVCVWDGDSDSWEPPVTHTMLPQASTLAKVWVYNTDTSEYVLEPVKGSGAIGHVLEGDVLVTNEPKPEYAPN